MGNDIPTDSPIDTEDQLLAGPHGDIPIRIYTPAAPHAMPIGVIWCHGGAYAYGTLDEPESHWVATRMAMAGITVIAVDYRLAPVPQWALDAGAEPGRGESHYPVPVDEVEAVLTWANSARPSDSPRGWSLGGASAGGTLVAAVTARVRDTGGVLPSRLVLAYPLLHAKLPPFQPELRAKVPSIPAAPIPLSPEVVALLTLNYVGGDLNVLADPYAFPGGHDVTGFPPTLVLNSDADTIRASGDAFAAELAAAGTDLVSIREEGTVHGHFSQPSTIGAERSVRRVISWLTSPWVDGLSDAGAEPATEGLVS